MIRNPARYLDYAKKEVVAACYYDVPAEAVERAAQEQRERGQRPRRRRGSEPTGATASGRAPRIE